MPALFIDPSEFLQLTEPPSYEQLDRLEELLAGYNTSAAEGSPEVSDQVYDRLKLLLETYRPDSPVLQVLWDDVAEAGYQPDDSDYDRHLRNHPMESIQTVKSWDLPIVSEFCEGAEEVVNFEGELELHFSHKINGHGIRVVYQDGVYVRATSRARSTRGRDLTAQMSHVVPPEIPEGGLVEIRGEVCLKSDNLELARQHTPGLKTPFSAVSSLLKPSSSPEENALLDFLAYRVFSDGEVPSTVSGEYDLLESWGFGVPGHAVGTLSEDEDVLEVLEGYFDSFVRDFPSEFFLDGVVLEVNDRSSSGTVSSSSGVYRGNALALKVGQYAQAVYSGIISEITWTPGRTKFSPVAVIEDGGVLTESGTTVQNVPLYEPAHIYNLQAYPGRPIHFKFGSEAGVVPCFEDGTLLTESTIASALGT